MSSPTLKNHETPGRSARIRPAVGWFGYWLRRPEPGIVLAMLAATAFVVLAVVLATWVPLVGVVACLTAGLVVWRTRTVWRTNAGRRRRGLDGF